MNPDDLEFRGRTFPLEASLGESFAADTEGLDVWLGLAQSRQHSPSVAVSARLTGHHQNAQGTARTRCACGGGVAGESVEGFE